MKQTSLIPLEDRVIIAPDPAPEDISGIELPDAQRKNFQPPKGTVLAVGPGKISDGRDILKKIYKLLCGAIKQEYEVEEPPRLEPGDRVYYGQYANMEVEDPVYKEKYLILRFADVFIKADSQENPDI